MRHDYRSAGSKNAVNAKSRRKRKRKKKTEKEMSTFLIFLIKITSSPKSAQYASVIIFIPKQKRKTRT